MTAFVDLSPEPGDFEWDCPIEHLFDAAYVEGEVDALMDRLTCRELEQTCHNGRHIYA